MGRTCLLSPAQRVHFYRYEQLSRKSELKPSDYVSTWTTADTDSKWRAWIEIGRDRSYKPIGGGKGIVVMEVVPDKKAHLSSEPFNIDIGVSSDVKDGQMLMGTESIMVPVTITSNH